MSIDQKYVFHPCNSEIVSNPTIKHSPKSMKRPALSLDYIHKKEHVDIKVNFDLKSLYSNPTVSIVETNETTLANFCAKNTIETAKIC